MKCPVCDNEYLEDLNLCLLCAGLLRWFRSYFAHELGRNLEWIKLETRFQADLGVESLDYMCWLSEAEEKLGVEIPDLEAERLQPVGQFLKYLRQHGTYWPENREIKLVQKSGCWHRYKWESFESS